MAKTRNNSRRSSNLLNENSNLIESSDPLRFERTSMQPSIDIVLTKNVSSDILSSNSNPTKSQLSSDWYEKLSQSESSKIMKATINNKKIRQKRSYELELSSTESESDQEPKKKKTKLNLNRKKNEECSSFSEKTSNFSGKLKDKTKKTINDNLNSLRKMRSKIFQKKNSTKYDENQFDHILDSSSLTQKNLNSSNIIQKFKEIQKIESNNETESQKSSSRILSDHSIPKISISVKNSIKLLNSGNKSESSENLRKEAQHFKSYRISNPLTRRKFSEANSTLTDIKNTLPLECYKNPRIILDRISLKKADQRYSSKYVPKIDTNLPVVENSNKKISSDNSIDDISFSENSDHEPFAKKKSTRTQLVLDVDGNSGYQSDPLQTSEPHQSTLNSHGKPLKRLVKQVISDTFESSMCNGDNQSMNQKNESVIITINDEDINKFLRSPSVAKKKEITSAFSPSVWAKAKKKTDAVKRRVEKQEEREKKIKLESDKKKTIIDAKLKRLWARRETERKRKLRKPIDKAYYVNGVPYKQPRLPKPKEWVTNRLYEHLWKCMKPKFGIRKKIKSEEFVIKLSNIYTIIMRRKKYENYVTELNDLLYAMAKLNVIDTRYDFYRFCSEFMPPAFNFKVVPMMLPGNHRNIPYDPDIVMKPILNEEDYPSSESESNSEKSSQIRLKKNSKRRSRNVIESDSE